MTRGLLVFDLDGTLFYGGDVTSAAVWETADRARFPRPEAEEIHKYFGRPFHEFRAWLRAFAPGRDIEAALDDIDRREVELVPEKGRLFDGVPEMLGELEGAGYRLAICSNGRHPYVGAVLRSMGIEHFFDPVRIRETEEEYKTLMARDVIASVGVKPVVVIGDRKDDVAAAKGNGAFSIGCAYGFGGMDEIGEADLIVNGPSEIPGAVEVLMGR
ncbi:MAG: HAD family hydrolase [Candidatus Eisenbacteria bacterium]